MKKLMELQSEIRQLQKFDIREYEVRTGEFMRVILKQFTEVMWFAEGVGSNYDTRNRPFMWEGLETASEKLLEDVRKLLATAKQGRQTAETIERKTQNARQENV